MLLTSEPLSALGALAPPYGDPARRGTLLIGVVNLLAPPAGEAAVARFRRLLAREAGDQAIDLRVVSAFSSTSFGTLDALRRAELDGLIVTGAEPSAAAIEDEPLLAAVAMIADGVASRTVSTIWSCFSAHAAVFHLNRIRREKLPHKLCGVYEVATNSAHRLLQGAAERRLVPHSRHNGLSETSLREHGFEVLSRSDTTGVDMFAKPHRGSLFLFLQGHPEYGRTTLLLEYARDVRRFRAGVGSYPRFPENSFAELGDEARTESAPPPWHEPARELFGNWLSYIAEAKMGADFTTGQLRARG